MPKLSIITINYNNREGLEKTIQSVVAQTYKEYEYIVIDGGSNDGSVDVIKKYEGYLTYWVSEPDKGIYNAMNKGTRVATGEYCQYLNSGDSLIHENVLKEIFSQNPTTDIFSSNSIWLPSKKLVQAPEDVTLDYLLNVGMNHQATFIKREILNQYPYDESLKIVGDYKFFLQAFTEKECNYRKLDIASVYYDQEGISSTQLELHFKEREKVIDELKVPQAIIKDYIVRRYRLKSDYLYKRMYKMDYYVKNPIARGLMGFIIGIFSAVYHIIDKGYKGLIRLFCGIH